MLSAIMRHVTLETLCVQQALRHVHRRGVRVQLNAHALHVSKDETCATWAAMRRWRLWVMEDEAPEAESPLITALPAPAPSLAGTAT
jgi:hypothetical protein